MAWAAEQKTGSASAKLLLIILANYADNAGVCWPSQERLANDTDMTERSIRNAIALLVELNLLSVSERRETHGVRKTNVYRLPLPENISDGEPDYRKNLPPTTGNGFRSLPEIVSSKPIKENLSEDRGVGASPKAALMEVLSAETADAIVEHRARLKAPLTVRAAKALAKQLAKWHDPEEAAATMLVRAWKGFEPEWMPKQPERKASVFPMPAWKPGRLA